MQAAEEDEEDVDAEDPAYAAGAVGRELVRRDVGLDGPDGVYEAEADDWRGVGLAGHLVVGVRQLYSWGNESIAQHTHSTPSPKRDRPRF